MMKRSIRKTVSDHFNVASLAKCLNVSRPTAYKYMEMYDNGREDLLPQEILNIFNTVCTRIPASGIDVYFNKMMAEYFRRVNESEDIPDSAADAIDGEDITPDRIESMIERARNQLDWLNKSGGNPADVASVEKDLSDLEYTLDLVKKRNGQRRFMLIGNMGVWTASDGKKTYPYIERNMAEIPGIEDMFRWCVVQSNNGYTVFFDNEGSDGVRVVLLAVPDDNRTFRPMGTFLPDPGMNYIRIPDLFLSDFWDFFRYRIERIRDGSVIDSCVCSFEPRSPPDGCM